MGNKVIVMQRTIDYILKNVPDKIRTIEALGNPEKVEADEAYNNYFIFRDTE